MTSKTTLGAILNEWLDLLGRNWRTILAYYVSFGLVLAGIDIGISTWLGEGFDPDRMFGPSQLIVLAVHLLPGYWVYCESLKRVMAYEGCKVSGGPLIFLTIIFAGLLTTVPILLGFLMLIFPGFILAARWSIAPALIVSKGQSALEGLKESWTATAASQGAIATATLLFMLAGIAVGLMTRSLTIGFGLRSPLDPQSGPVLVYRVADQMFNSLAMGFSLLLCVAVYKLLDVGRSEIDEVFG